MQCRWVFAKCNKPVRDSSLNLQNFEYKCISNISKILTIIAKILNFTYFLSEIKFLSFFAGRGNGGSTTCRLLVPQPGIELTPPTVVVQSLNQWTAREVPRYIDSNMCFLVLVFTIRDVTHSRLLNNQETDTGIF